MQSSNFRSRGIGLLELMLTLLVLAAILFSATRYYKITQENLRVEQAVTMVSNTITAAHQWSESVTDTTGLTLQTLINAGLVPPSYAKGNPWGGKFLVSWVNYLLTLRVNGIPRQESCVSLREKMQNYFNPNHLNPECVRTGGGTYSIMMTF